MSVSPPLAGLPLLSDDGAHFIIHPPAESEYHLRGSLESNQPICPGSASSITTRTAVPSRARGQQTETPPPSTRVQIAAAGGRFRCQTAIYTAAKNSAQCTRRTAAAAAAARAAPARHRPPKPRTSKAPPFVTRASCLAISQPPTSPAISDLKSPVDTIDCQHRSPERPHRRRRRPIPSHFNRARRPNHTAHHVE